MKVVHISTRITGGAGVAAYRLHESLMRDSSEVKSTILQKEPLEQDLIRNKVERCTLYHPISYRIKKKLGLLAYFSKSECYQRGISKQDGKYELTSLPFSYYPLHTHPSVQEADIIHLHWVNDFIDYPSFFSAVDKPIVWTLHDQNPFLGIYHYEGDMKRNSCNDTLSRFDKKILNYKKEVISTKKNIHIACPSKWMCDSSSQSDMFRSYGHSIIPYGLDYDQYPEIDKKEVKKYLGIDNNKKTILFVADYIDSYRKGIDFLIEALLNVSTDSYNLVSVGKGSISVFKDKVKSYTHLGALSSINLLNIVYATADLTIIPSREDNLPNVMLESFANGTPVLSFANGGMAEHIQTGENGILVSEMTADCLARSIKDFLDGKYVFDPKKIRRYAMETFNYQKLANSYTELYKSLLNQHN